MLNKAEKADFPIAPEGSGLAEPVRLRAYLSLLLIICFFSGIFGYLGQGLSIFDFNRLLGDFGIIGGQDSVFVGKGGTGARHGFLFALSMVPTVMLALGTVGIAEHFGAIQAARRLLTPLLRPVLGLPGEAGLALITSTQSSDSGGAMTRALYDSGCITDRERSVMGAFQFSAGAAITVYLTASSAFIPALEISWLIPLVVILFYKVVGTNFMRLYLAVTLNKKETKEVGRAQ